LTIYESHPEDGRGDGSRRQAVARVERVTTARSRVSFSLL
jgi:hypothetical protein